MLRLNLPSYPLRMKEAEGQKWIFDEVRKKFLVLTPEEWVRQNFVHYLIKDKGVPPGLIAIEMGLKLNKTKKRSDIVACSPTGDPLLIVECKATSVKITQAVFDQIARYNITLKGQFLVVTNGLEHFCCQMFFETGTYKFLPNIPSYTEMVETL